MSSVKGSITHIGLGNMGTALVQAFLKSGIAVTTWNRTADRPGVKAVAAAGAVYQADLASAVSQNDTITICVLEYKTVHQILDEAAQSGWLKGKSIINLTNGTPKQARGMDAFFKSHGAAQYLDAAVMVTPQVAITGQGLVVASGETEETFNRLQGFLSPVGRVMYRGSDAGAAALFDVAALACMSGMFQGAIIMFGLLKRQAPDASIELLDGKEPRVGPLARDTLVPFLQLLVPYLGLIADGWDQRNWSENNGNGSGMMGLALKNILEACQDEGVDGSGLSPFLGWLEKAVQDFGEDCGISTAGQYAML